MRLASNWFVLEADGHNFNDLDKAFEMAASNKGKPTLIIAHTVKGKGIPFAEGKAAFHNGVMNREQYREALDALEM